MKLKTRLIILICVPVFAVSCLQAYLSNSPASGEQETVYQHTGSNENTMTQELEKEKIRIRYKNTTTAMLTGIVTLLMVAFLLYKNNSDNKKAKLRFEQQAQEIDEQRQITENTREELRATQLQLMHSEKMASLGELTAGIAHEIQNPLNFVNNFAEINSDIIKDIKAELEKGNTGEAIALTDDIRNNNEKIAHHGKRADSIVKGMLEHSRKNTGLKEATELNVLVDECLRLSYHGLRAADKSFNASFNANFDPSVGSINLVRQDIGRVLLNFFNNAFFAISEKKEQAGNEYEPTLTVSTQKKEDSVLLTITDNGNGIPANVQEKIFQPFFTTKPTGKGTGLGLSISHEIITKVHGGTIAIDTREGEYTTFLIELPIC